MPDAGEHQVGAFVANLLYWVISAWSGNFFVLLLSWVAAAFGGAAPDMLEPATWYDHRGAWHYAIGFFSIFPAIALLGSNALGYFIGAFCIGYFSHFLLDVTT
jgi:membrane-bound metal-dependent hydrolase YbcI (DUF457 family)